MPKYPPFRILVDNSEGLPYAFESIKAAAEYSVSPPMYLETGDYVVDALGQYTGREQGKALLSCATIERKTLSDLYTTLTAGRERFMNEMGRMTAFGYAAIVIEASWEMIGNPNDHLSHETKASPKSIIGSLLAIEQRFGVHIHCFSCRELSERLTFRILERWHKEHHTP